MRRSIALVSWCAVVAFAGAVSACAQSSQLSACVDATRQSSGVPGALLVTTNPNNNIVSGLGTISPSTPLQLNDRFRIGSTTKTFVATVILQLVGEKKFTLDTYVVDILGSAALANVPNADDITIRELLDMTSGVYDYNDAGFQNVLDADPGRIWTPEEILATIKNKTPPFTPGATCSECLPAYCGVPNDPSYPCWKYSNTNYIILGLVVEKVTGTPVGTQIQKRIIDPLRLSHTTFPTTTGIDKPYSSGYQPPTGNLKCPSVNAQFDDVSTCYSPSCAWSAGAMISNTADLLVWLHALTSGSLLTPELQKERMTFIKGNLAPGFPVEYGLGVMKLDNFIGHGGEFFGYASMMFQGQVQGCDYSIVDFVNVFPEANGTETFLTLFNNAQAILCQGGQCSTGAQAPTLLRAKHPTVKGDLWKVFKR